MKTLFVLAAIMATVSCLPKTSRKIDKVAADACQDNISTCRSIETSCDDISKYPYMSSFCANTCGFCGKNCQARQDNPKCNQWTSVNDGFCDDIHGQYGFAMINCPHDCDLC